MSDLVLDSCIEIKQEEVTRQRSIIHSIHFYLNDERLVKIQDAQTTGQSLYLPPHLLTQLRYYVLFGQSERLSSGLTFSSYYDRGNMPEGMLRSLISLDGDIVHKIRRDCLEDQQLAVSLTSAHYWLIEQLLYHLRFRNQGWVNWLSWLFSLILLGSNLLVYWERFKENPWLFLASLVATWFFQIGIQKLLQWLLPKLRRWILRQILFGFFARNPRWRMTALSILGRLGF